MVSKEDDAIASGFGVESVGCFVDLELLRFADDCGVLFRAHRREEVLLAGVLQEDGRGSRLGDELSRVQPLIFRHVGIELLRARC